MVISNYFRVLTVAVLAGMMILLVAAAEPARAGFPGANGKLVFDSQLPGQADAEIVTLFYKPGGPVPEDPSSPLTDNTSSDSGAAWSPNG